MMNAETGQTMTLEDHVYQSVERIIFTLVGTRLMRRQFGSVLPSFLDDKPTEFKLAQMRAGIVFAIMKFEPRLTLQKVYVYPSDTIGGICIDMTGNINDRDVTWSMQRSTANIQNGVA